jgi:hypothetical protein
MASRAHALGMSIGLKNSLAILGSVQNVVEFAVNESCVQYNECGVYNSFISSKPVFHIEYMGSLNAYKVKGKRWVNSVSQGCTSYPSGLSTVIKTIQLDGSIQFCNGQVANTAVVN